MATKRKDSSGETEIFVDFQNTKDGDQTKNASTFDRVSINNAYVTPISDRYPAIDNNLSSSNQKFYIA